MKKVIFIFLFLFSTKIAFNQTIHFLVVTDVSDQKYAMVTNRGTEQIKKIFETIAFNLGYKPLNPIYLSNNTFDSENVLKKISEIKAQSNDIIIFYYSGQTIYPQNSNSQYPSFKLNDAAKRNLSMDEVGQMLLTKGTSLAFEICDSRNNFLKLEIPTKPKSLKRPTVVISNKNKEIVKNLIATTCGLVKIASNEKGGSSNIIKRTILTKNDDGISWSPVSDPYEYSAFSLAFYDVFDHILKKSNTSVTFSDLIKGIQFRLNYELNPTDDTNREQDIKWDIIKCANVTDIPKLHWENLPKTYEALEIKLNDLLDIKDLATRTQYIENLKLNFGEYVKAFNVSKISNLNKGVDQDPITKNYISLNDYLRSLKSFNPLVNSIKIIQIPNLKVPIAKGELFTMEEYYNN